MTEEGRRGRIWLQQNRPDLAESELRQALETDPDDAENHMALAACLLALERPAEGLEEAERAVSLEPDWHAPHVVRAHALQQLGRSRDAEAAAREGLALEREDVDVYTALAFALGSQGRWRKALDAAEQGLSVDPDDSECANARALALIQLGEGESADLTLEAALQRDPDSPLTHQSLGWAALHSGKAREAITHYREALRLDPSSDSARAGLVEALNARNLVYRLFLRWFLLLTRMRPRTAFALILGTVVARMLIRSIARANPALGPLLWPLFWAMVAFVLMTWIARPLFNLVLRLDRDGRYALSASQRIQTNWLAGLLGGAAFFAILWLLGIPAMGAAAVLCAVLSIPVVTTVDLRPSPRRRWLATFTIALVVLGVGYVGISYSVEPWLGEFLTWYERLPPGTTDPEITDAISRWPEYERAAFLEVMNRVPEFKDRVLLRKTLLNFLLWGFVAFTWIASALGSLGGEERRGK